MICVTDDGSIGSKVEDKAETTFYFDPSMPISPTLHASARSAYRSVIRAANTTFSGEQSLSFHAWILNLLLQVIPIFYAVCHIRMVT